MLGLGKGKIEIKINKFSFSPGEIIDGQVLLSLKDPVEAKELSVTLLGEKLFRQRKGGSSRTVVFEFKQPLDGEKTYQPTDQPLAYSFRIKIPPTILSQNKPALPEGIAGSMIGMMLNSSTSPTSWYLVAKLDISKAFDISKKISINIA